MKYHYYCASGADPSSGHGGIANYSAKAAPLAEIKERLAATQASHPGASCACSWIADWTGSLVSQSGSGCPAPLLDDQEKAPAGGKAVPVLVAVAVGVGVFLLVRDA